MPRANTCAQAHLLQRQKDCCKNAPTLQLPLTTPATPVNLISSMPTYGCGLTCTSSGSFKLLLAHLDALHPPQHAYKRMHRRFSIRLAAW